MTRDRYLPSDDAAATARAALTASPLQATDLRGVAPAYILATNPNPNPNPLPLNLTLTLTPNPYLYPYPYP